MKHEISLNRIWGSKILRLTYIAALIGFACLCYVFYSQQTDKSEITNEVRGMYDSLVELDVRMGSLVKKISFLKHSYNLNEYEPSTSPYSFAPSKNPKSLINVKDHLLHEISGASAPFISFLEHWEKCLPKFSALSLEVKNNSFKFFSSDLSFSNYKTMLDINPILNAKTDSDIVDIISNIENIYSEKIKSENIYLFDHFRVLLDEQAKQQESFFLKFIYSILGFFSLLTLLAYVPIDVYLSKLISGLRKQSAAKASSDSAKIQYLANKSQEIEMPLNAMLGLAQKLSNEELNPDQKASANLIVSSFNSALKHLKDIQTFSNRDFSNSKLINELFNLNDLVEDASSLISAQLLEKEIEFIVRIDEDLPKQFTGDSACIRQILTSLLSNALKFTDKGYVSLDVSGAVEAYKAPKDKCALLFKIEDSGSGLDEKQLSHTREYLAKKNINNLNDGSEFGTGLALSKKLVDLYEGEISAESTLGEGSTFWFKLELGNIDGVEEIEDKEMTVTGKRILVVDDNEIALAALSEKMVAWGFDHAACSNGQEALDILRAAMAANMNIDCVLLDYQMKPLSGKDVVEVMKGDDSLKDIPVIMQIGNDDTDAEEALASLGVQGQLIKPVRSSHMLELIQEVIANTSQSDAKVISDEAVDELSDKDEVDAFRSELGEQSETAIQNQTVFVETKTVESASDTSSQNVADAIDVLVCEDNEVNQVVFSQILEMENLNYRIANNGEEGVEMFKALNPQLVLMDVSMPKMNGLEATAAIRQYQGDDLHTPIIGVTAHAIKGDMEKCLEAGMDDYLSKPVSPDALVEKIRSWRNKASSSKISA